jgi:hypothetical protein
MEDLQKRAPERGDGSITMMSLAFAESKEQVRPWWDGSASRQPREARIHAFLMNAPMA